MSHNHVLIDFENVQPKGLAHLQASRHRVHVFVGASQTKVSLELATALQAFGPDARYVQISGNGSNALDFHIAYYIGRISAADPEASFTIVSRDTGFDPLLKHLAGQGIQGKRVARINDVPGARSAPPAKGKAQAPARGKAAPAVARGAGKAPSKQAAVALERLRKQKNHPRSMRTLGSAIKSWFKPALSDARAAEVIQELAAAGRVDLSGARISYRLD